MLKALVAVFSRKHKKNKSPQKKFNLGRFERLEEKSMMAALTALPSLSSLPGAAASLYLDFNGHFEAQWGPYQNITTPVFTLDADLTTFSDSELAAITSIWKRVTEDYLPFKINVTTVEPASFADKVGLRVSIGGAGAWYGNAGGVALRSSFTNSYVNTVFVFDDKLANNEKYVAEAASHEAGHSFGLAHQAKYDSTGKLLESYNSGGNGWAPLMGLGYYQARTTWHNGATYAATALQDDMAIISNTINGFGYRDDDNLIVKPLTVTGTSVAGKGIIEKLADTDSFSFRSGAGTITLNLSVAQVGANLDSVLELRNAAGTLIATSAPTTTLGASITVTVPEDNYILTVKSQGKYGDVGEYNLSGQIVTPLILNPEPPPPTDPPTEPPPVVKPPKVPNPNKPIKTPGVHKNFDHFFANLENYAEKHGSHKHSQINVEVADKFFNLIG